MTAKLIAVQLETQSGAEAWYAYYDGEPDLAFEEDSAAEAWKAEVTAAAKEGGSAPGAGLDFDNVEQDEVPGALSMATGTRRYRVAVRK